MDNLLLKTMILIMKDPTSGKPIVISSFHGFESEQEAQDFSNYLKEMTIDEMLYEDNPKQTLH
ncbi:hypothetical protein [uncultured Mediterranean phage uvMED]|jgi:hypothetical protein|nr:hypothetical protein [uncultured Mediterranean phage uvMED]BAR18609.1 hypothetical protein [uncultured Mediterranean phage uvMED]BAR18698.1 hypothetical protein [uncultured Mediterranean phage uvMED]BAR18725.1 hypothetical protein [uncultured Mediterranean phage uvMED]BAR18828.1 hypothetical protein [uncultured Mediterranean phage uvMED]